MKRCANCVYFAESVGYCPIHDRDVTRYNGCDKHMNKREYQAKLEDDEQEQESTESV